MTTPLSVTLTVGSTNSHPSDATKGIRAPSTMGTWCRARGHSSGAAPGDPARPAPAQGEHHTCFTWNTQAHHAARPAGDVMPIRATLGGPKGVDHRGRRSHHAPCPALSSSATLTGAETSALVSRPDPHVRLRRPRRLWDAQ
ncbi:hypothetical protein CSO01_36290 [Cellulomonas soli]|uniref:Uncharacterized protein n=1 Tax=Cellulomonas soli TaxID=931535 RepID=A0A512PI84_9CELL|nr:hypothetical protein CSO01_36290 [Cellulomonas soli]